MSILKAKEYLKSFGYDDKVIEFETSSATVELAANALNCKPQMIAKTLSFLVGENPILIVVAGNYKVNNSKFKAEFSTKPKMIEFEKVEELIGHAIGGVCPFGINSNVKVYLDVSLKENEIVYPACGSSNSAIKLSILELEKLSNYEKWVDVSATIEK